MAQVTIGPQTLGSLKAMITRFHKEDENADLLTDAANDAIESLWRNVLLVALGQFMSAPVTNLTIAAGSERATIVSIPDPTIAPTLLTPAGGNLPSRSVNIAYTFVTESGSETNLSPGTIVVPGANQLVNIVSPTDPIPAGGSPIGYNVYGYIGGLADPVQWGKQNAQPISFGTNWQEDAVTGVTNAPDKPGPPASNTTADNIFFIRVMQVQNTDGTWTTWTASQIDSLLTERATRSIASTSTYQGYAYDVFNGNVIEIRPAAGATLSPRYFFVIKPRRMLYDNAQLPFSNFSYIEYLKLYAGSQLDLSNKEYVGYGAKGKKAAGILQEILQGLNQQATIKQKTITPFFQW